MTTTQATTAARKLTASERRRLKVREEAAAELREYLKPGDTIDLILRHRSRSGMFRRISPTFQHPKRGRLHLDYLFHRVYNPESRKSVAGGDGVPVGGCGMDMGFQLVYSVAAVLWPDGYRCPGKSCGDSDHSNPPYPKRDGRTKHKHGSGYALKSNWL